MMRQYGKQKLSVARILPKGPGGSRHCDPTTPTKSGRAKERHGVRREVEAQLEEPDPLDMLPDEVGEIESVRWAYWQCGEFREPMA